MTKIFYPSLNREVSCEAYGKESHGPVVDMEPQRPATITDGVKR